MPLTFVSDIESVSVPLNLGYIVDLTTYGGPNPARNELAVLLYLFKRDASQNNTAVSIDNSNPLTATQWQFTLPTPDGVFSGTFLGVRIWQAGVYANLSGVYYGGVYYRSNTSTSGIPGISANWDVVTDPLATFVGNSTVEQTQVYMWSSARAEAGVIGDSLADLADRIRDGKCSNWQDAATALTGAGALNGAFANFRRGDYINAQKDIDWLDAQTVATL